jgi:hypothetical protein
MTDLLIRRASATGAQVSESMSSDNADGTESSETELGTPDPADTQATEPGEA